MASERPRKYKRHIPKRLDGRRNCRIPADAPRFVLQAEPGWLTVSDYAEKYELVRDTVRQWVQKDILEAKPLATNPKTGKVLIYQVLDAPPDKHPGWARFLSEGRVPGHRGGVRRNIVKPVIETPDDADLEKRKARLKETYLPRFFEMEKQIPGRIAYTARELKDHLGERKEDGTYTPLNNHVLHIKWPSWGLRVTPLRNDNPSEFNSEKIKKVGFAIDNKTKLAYKRDDLYSFLSGQWSPKGVSDIDDRLNQQIVGAPTTEDGYYHYDKNRVYPLDAKGFFAWVDDVKPMLRCKLKNDIVPLKLFPWQRKFVTEMLRMGPDGRYIYNVGFASAPRGEGKSQIIKLIALFRFFNGYAEDIKIAGNSKLEGESVHYDEMRDMITDTPKLINFPGIDVKGKHIVIMKGPKDIFNKIECVPKSSGLHPNMTLGLITELHNYTPQDKKFYNNFLSSRRGTPNAMVLVDSTVEDPGTIIHDEWKKYSAGKLEMTYFFHRDSDDGYENPETTPKYLADEATRYSEDEYRKIYENKWGGASSTYFGVKAIKQIKVAGIDGIYGPSAELSQAIGNMHDLELNLQKFIDTKVKESSLVGIRGQIDAISSRLNEMDDIYRFPASWDDLEKLMKLFGIRAWVIGASVDRASGEQINSDRTALVCVGRGIVDEFTSYYFLLDVFMPFTAESGALERKLEEWRERYYDVDKTVITEYQGLDLSTWCAKNGFEVEFQHTTYKYQKPLFSSMYQIIHKGYFKSPTVPYYTDERGQLYEGYTNKADIFTEELGAFRHVSMGDKSGKFGPPDKRKRGGIKDDVVDAVCGALFACNGEGMEDIARNTAEKAEFKAEIYGNPDLVGTY